VDTKRIYDYQATITKDSPRNSAYRKWKQRKPQEDGKYQTTGRKDKESESNIDSAAHDQTLKQQKQLNGRKHHILTNIHIECQLTQFPHQKTPFDKLD
jgi:hypothetical protein